MKQRQPILIDLAGRRVVIVGGGRTAARKIESLLPSGARIEVVSPRTTARVRQLAADGRVHVVPREFSERDLEDSWLVIAATGDSGTDAGIAGLCEGKGIWCVCTSSAGAGSAAIPAVARTADSVQVAVSAGGDPTLAICLRDSIAMLLQMEVLPLPRDAQCSRRNASSASLGLTDAPGRVILVGAGPGDPDLVTVRGLRAIAEADVLVVDRLAPHALWDDAPRGVEVVEVGKMAGTHAASQDQINKLLVDRARVGGTVVRLKGGDPFVFGRGAEEAQACLQAGLSVEVVPGVTSALAVPAAAGIPATSRGVASAFLVASAHDGPDALGPAVLAAQRDTTLILMMGARHLVGIARALIGHGRPEETPAAVIESGWTKEANVKQTTLGEILAVGEPARAPAVIVVGEVAGLGAKLGRLAEPSKESGHC